MCVYYQDWHRSKRPKPAVEGGILPAVCQAVSVATQPTVDWSAVTSGFNAPRNTLSSSTGVVVALNTNLNHQNPAAQISTAAAGATSTGLTFDEEAKLVFGVVISLRNMIKKLSGRYVCSGYLLS